MQKKENNNPIHNKSSPRATNITENLFENMSSTEISSDIIYVLKLGLSYTTTVKTNYLPTRKIIANIEDDINNFEENDQTTKTRRKTV